MSYLVLARKYRPRVFADVVGQEVVTGTLRGAIAEGRIGHAYLFCGPRGTGKTTTARIFAKALNCEKGPAPDPCNVCERCLAADNGSEVDIIEVDAASHTGVDYVREMREQAAYMPLRARFKIYLIDEVHMLSKGAFNALLKTLEEPPPHVKFLFATTELERLPETIVSRCQLLRLVPLAERTIVDRLGSVFDAEGVKAAPGVAAEIARRARGGMRDALSIADQLLSLAGNELEVADLAQISGESGTEELDRLLDAVEARELTTLLSSLPVSEGGEAELLSSLLDHVRATLVVHVCGDAAPLVEVEPSARARMHERASRVGVERLQIWLEELLQARERMRLVPSHARLVLEVVLLDLARQEATLSLTEIAERLAALEQRLQPVASSTAGAPANRAMPPRASAASVASTSAADAHASTPNSREPSSEREVIRPRARPSGGSPSRASSSSGDSSPRASPRDGGSPPQAFPSDGGASPRTTSSDAGASPHRMPSSDDDTTARGAARFAVSAVARSSDRADAMDSSSRPSADESSARSGASDAWTRCIESLAAERPGLAELLKQHAKLADADGSRAVVKLGQVGEAERAMLADARNVRACAQALSRALGRAVSVAFEAAGPAARAPKDPYTNHVADLFGGRIEEER